MDLVHMATCSIHWRYTVLVTWIQTQLPVEFDGFGTHGYMLYSLG